MFKKLLRKKIFLFVFVVAVIAVVIIIPSLNSFRTSAAGETVYVGPAISDDWILPSTTVAQLSSYGYTAYSSSNPVYVVAAPGEFEPVSLVVRAGSFNTTITPTVPASLVNTEDNTKTIPASKIDIRYIKVWWQSRQYSLSRSWFRGTGRALYPELLLKDPTLVMRGEEIGGDSESDYVKMTAGVTPVHDYITFNGSKYVKTELMSRGESTATLSIQDSPTTLPMNLSPGKNQQIWVTIEIPEGTTAGNYSGIIGLGDAGSVNITVRVPFSNSLDPSPKEHIIEPYLLLAGPHIGQQKSVDQYQAELLNEYKHGITSPLIMVDRSNLGTALSLIPAEWKARTNTFYYYYGASLMHTGSQKTGRYLSASELQSLRQEIHDVLVTAKSKGFATVYFYGVDEASAICDPSFCSICCTNGTGILYEYQYPRWRIVHEEGRALGMSAKTFVCGQWNVARTVVSYDNDPDTDLDLMSWAGGINNVNTNGRCDSSVIDSSCTGISSEKVMHKYGHKIFAYSNPMGGVELPETFRRNYGLLIWQKDYDGGELYANYHNEGDSTNVWSDFFASIYRGETFVYPTNNGVIDTIQWEGFREGVDDMKYLATLQRAINLAPAGTNKTNAENFVASIKNTSNPLSDLNRIRHDIIDQILLLTGGEPLPPLPSPTPGPTTTPTPTPTINYPPELRRIGDKTVVAGTNLTFTVSATDRNGDALTYLAYGFPLSATFTPSTRTFSWTPALNRTGLHDVTFRVSDGSLFDEEVITIEVLPPDVIDTTPPIRYEGWPRGTLPSKTVSETVSLTTNENAICRYSVSAGSYDSMGNTFSITNGINHSMDVSGLIPGNTYDYHVMCSDMSGNKNTDDFLISFRINEIPTPGSETKTAEDPSKDEKVVQIIDRISSLITILGLIFVPLLVLYSAFLYITSGGNSEQLIKARRVFKIALIVTFASLLLKAVLTFLKLI